MLSRVWTTALATATCLSLAACDTATPPVTETISGTVLYRERMALPPDAKVTVSLVDVSLADAPATVIGQTEIMPKGQVPIPYRLDYDAAQIIEKHSYALQARITVQDELLFINTARHEILTDDENPTDILVNRVK